MYEHIYAKFETCYGTQYTQDEPKLFDCVSDSEVLPVPTFPRVIQVPGPVKLQHNQTYYYLCLDSELEQDDCARWPLNIDMISKSKQLIDYDMKSHCIGTNTPETESVTMVSTDSN